MRTRTWKEIDKWSYINESSSCTPETHIKSEITSAAAAKSLQSCPTLCDPIDGGLPDSPVPGILQARTLEWVAISFPNAWKWKVKVKSLSRIRLFATAWTAAYQAPPSMGFPRQEYWSGVPLPSPLSDIWLVNIFSNSVCCLFRFFAGIFESQIFLILIKFNLCFILLLTVLLVS